jgi:dipeptidyl-peptidase-3
MKYEDVRVSEGFKNLALSNRINATSSGEKCLFIPGEDLEEYEKLRTSIYTIQVSVHESLGHGSGRLLAETSAGSFNFAIDDPPLDPISLSPVKSWYKLGETWESVFGSIAASYEECRAELVQQYMMHETKVLEIFGVPEQDHERGIPPITLSSTWEKTTNMSVQVLYYSYMIMAAEGLHALENYDPEKKVRSSLHQPGHLLTISMQKWGQAHARVRKSIYYKLDSTI